ncbi:trimeric intracellular cation channel family protein [Geobacter sulfurreducens]|jgi:uncharacterized membrane protein YeiH|uniref:Membrane protein, UPF0126 and UPF0126 domain-containing n=1 Tax=Geobacter sulfurreducens (strain ATCC 51573 / DSM 12127 / PCA) TaxID=243231 RepID=Q74DV7_GEOSL|nr:trimeric intracellular cation channel family protein [Geobacter sulfurreducens]AAR34584.1 membrane protein, UPF0126 and UPF0126 domain-containing [Geobacter sulfurreducens PCA]ADI84043.1 membrane protein, UPF0126 and UPF0126 domain-containing [Geobacter sulfurreducens KN400]AJY70919.1 membrane protein [Geobacter sulfurreducens]QVW36426.1 trimeric intracellular cation channel family protein [Geobacter sulfurreducens]UAC05239.1 trimeric intracellular cation channel family protein [Geobacter s
MITALDVFGTFVFALSGAFRAIKYELDLLGVLVLAVATGVGGGMIRDLLLGTTPPMVFRNESYLAICVAGGLLVFLAAGRLAPIWDWVMVADAVGLGVFAAIGAQKGAAGGLGGFGIVMMAAMTATGGGVVRDILVMEIPAVLRTDFYASAAILGGACFVAARAAGAPEQVQLFTCLAVTLVLRLLAMRFGLSLPRIKGLAPAPGDGGTGDGKE